MLFDNLTLSALRQIPFRQAEFILVNASISHRDLTITGSGRIFQDETGILRFQLINHRPPDPQIESWNLLQTLGEGMGARRQYAGDYAKLTGADAQGCEISCQHIDLDSFFERAVYEGTFRSQITIRKPGDKPFAPDRASIVFKNKYAFATNDYDAQANSEDGHLEYRMNWRHTWQLSTGDMELKYHKDLKHLQLDIAGKDLSVEKLKQTVQGLDFVMGLEHDEYYQLLFEETTAAFEALINPNTQPFVPSTLFQAPYLRAGHYGDEAEENAKLFTRYYQYLQQHPGTLLTKWHKRLVDAGTGYYYRFGLTLSIAVEKILQELYPNNESPLSYDPVELAGLTTHAEILTDQGLQQKLKDFIHRLTNNNNYVPGKMLEKLEKENVISKGAMASWKKLRNSYAHGSDHNHDADKALDLFTQNSTLYHELIFHRIGYSGKYINFFQAKNGKPADYPLEK